MAGAVIIADQPAGAGNGVAGVARNDLWRNKAVNLSIGVGGNTTYLWELLDVPPGSAATLSTPTAPTSSFTPDVIGTYRVRLTVNGGGNGNVQTRVYRVRFSPTGTLEQRGWAYPAVDETKEEANYDGNTRGWAEALYSILEDARLNAFDAATLPTPSGTQYAVLMEDPGGSLVFQQITAEMIVPAFAIASFAKTAPNGGTLLYRRGDTITGVTASASYTSGPPNSASIANTYGGSTDVGDVDPGVWTINAPFAAASLAGSILRNGSDLGADPTWTATLTAIKGTTKTATFTVQWTRDVYYGVGVAGINSEAAVEALAGTTLATGRSRTITVSPSNEKVYYAYPKSYGAATFTLNGFPAAFNAPTEISLTNVNGVTSTYYLYESTNLLTGSNLSFVVT